MHTINQEIDRRLESVRFPSDRLTPHDDITVGAVGISHITKLRDDDIPASKYIFSEEQYHLFCLFVLVLNIC